MLEYIRSFVDRHDGAVIKHQQSRTEGFLLVLVYVPVAHYFELKKFVQSNSNSSKFSVKFSHWTFVDGNPLENGTYANRIVMNVRERKELTLILPKLEELVDRTMTYLEIHKKHEEEFFQILGKNLNG